MPLTLVVPVSASDVSRLDSFVSVMEFLGGLQKHFVLFCCAPSVQPLVTEAASRLRQICPNTVVEALPRDPEPRGRFGAFNTIFRDSIELLYKRGNKNPWVWWELDTRPIRAGYADRLELEYHQKGQPFMGVRRKGSDTIRGANGEVIDDKDPRVQGDYMVAVGIYPPNFKDYSMLYKYPDPTGAMPSDVTIRHEVNKHLHDTRMIAHHYKTCNYRRDGGNLVCDDYQHTDGWPKYGGIVSEMAYVVHGVKDDSLDKLILSEAPSNVMPSGIVAASVDNAELVSLRAQNEEMRKDIARMQEQWRVKENSYAEEIESLKEKFEVKGAITDTSDLTKAVETMRESAGTDRVTPPKIEDVRKAVSESKQKRMVGDWAADFKISKDEMRKLIETPESGLKITKPGPPFVALAA